MNLDFKCKNCNSREYFNRTVMLPGKNNNKFKIKLHTYYLNICSNCGYTDFYAAEIIDKESKKSKEKIRATSNIASSKSVAMPRKVKG